jgi:S1-C subfamily serine protease
LAVIKIDPVGLDLTILELSSLSELRVGQFVVAIGNPFGLEQTLTFGVISALGRIIQSPDERFIGQVIQTDAAINPGNSGGPLLDLHGRVIGVNSQIVSPSRASAGIGFAVPVDTVALVVPELITQGRYPHPWLGATLLQITPERAQLLRESGVDISVDRGVLVIETVPNASAAQAGIRGGDQLLRLGRNVQLPVGGDVITKVDGREVTDEQMLMVFLDTQTRVGQTITVTVSRGSEVLEIPVTLGERPVRR